MLDWGAGCGGFRDGYYNGHFWCYWGCVRYGQCERRSDQHFDAAGGGVWGASSGGWGWAVAALELWGACAGFLLGGGAAVAGGGCGRHYDFFSRSAVKPMGRRLGTDTFGGIRSPIAERMGPGSVKA